MQQSMREMKGAHAGLMTMKELRNTQILDTFLKEEMEWRVGSERNRKVKDSSP